jgi:GNAT superfamily N-acetyltransferase
VRPARPGEAEAVAALVRAAFARHVEAVGRRPAPMDDDHAGRIAAGQQHVLDGSDEGMLVASVVLVDAGDHLVVENVAVDPARQGEGHGRALLAFAEDETRRRGLPEIRLSTNEKMDDNLLIYPHLGYVEVGREEQHGYHRVLYAKRV